MKALNKQFDTYLQEKLDERSSKGLLRSLLHADGKTDFSSNDYFGFSRMEAIRTAGHSELAAGATGSRSITGNSVLAEETEKMIAAFHNREAALIFNAGYMANVGLFSSLAGKNDTYISDEYIHASIIDGMRLSYANRLKFRHNSLEDLEKKLQVGSGNKFVVVESVYSMDGDMAPLKEIVSLCQKHKALLIVDEAHATGIFGEKGEGVVCELGLSNDVYACIYTFGKALGLHGAVITGSHTLRNFLINNARSFIFTTALPPQAYLQVQAAYQLLPLANREKLFELIRYFKHSVQQYPSLQFMDSPSPIQGIIIGDSFKTRALSEHLLQHHIFVKGILPPTVPPGTERLRICIHSFNTEKEIDILLQEIISFLS